MPKPKKPRSVKQTAKPKTSKRGAKSPKSKPRAGSVRRSGARKTKAAGKLKATAVAAESLPTKFVTDAQCPPCVRAAVGEWCGQPVYDFSMSLRDIYAPKGACGTPALSKLRQILGLRCQRTPSLSDLSCSMSFSDLRLLVCGM